MVIFFRSLFILVFLASAKGQYMDAIVPVQFKDPGQAFRSNDQYQLSGNSIDLNQSIIIEGGAIRFSGDTSATVWVQFLRPDGQWADKTQAKIFIEPLLMLQSAFAYVPKSRNNNVISIFLIFISLLFFFNIF